MKMFRVWPKPGAKPSVEKTADAVAYWLDMAEAGDTITIKAIEMTEAEYEALPEYMGP
jgi:hypothetical protein